MRPSERDVGTDKVYCWRQILIDHLLWMNVHRMLGSKRRFVWTKKRNRPWHTQKRMVTNRNRPWSATAVASISDTDWAHRITLKTPLTPTWREPWTTPYISCYPKRRYLYLYSWSILRYVRKVRCLLSQFSFQVSTITKQISLSGNQSDMFWRRQVRISLRESIISDNPRFLKARAWIVEHVLY